MKYHIISIGVSKHQTVRPNLTFASKDAIDFYELVAQNIPNIGSKQLLVDSEATLSAVQTALAAPELLTADKDDALFFFFSGHGTIAQDDGEPTHYLVTFDATADFAHSCVAVKYLKTALSKIPCKAQFIFVDSCFSGAMSKGAKYLPVPKFKDLKAVPKLAEVIPGVGNVVFTASKDNEEAIELADLEHGLFTHAVLSELQKRRIGTDYPIADIFDPITKAVVDEAKKNHHVQTPTILGHLEGSVHLPAFSVPLKVTPQLLDTPRFQELDEQTFTAPNLTLSNKEQEKAINHMVKMVTQTQRDRSGRSAFSNFCADIRQVFAKKWEQIFQASHDPQLIPGAVAKLEGESFQLIALGAVVTVYGTEQQMQEYAEMLVSILELKEGRAGYVALIDVPEVIILLVVYVVGIASLGVRDLGPFDILLKTHVINLNSDKDPLPLYTKNEMHYSSALGGYASKVADHVGEVIGSYEWLGRLVPRAQDGSGDLRQQVNFLLSMLSESKGLKLWPDFGRFYPSRVRSLVDRLKFDSDYIKQTASLLGVKPDELRKKMADYLEAMMDRGLDRYFWDSVRPHQLLTEAERKALGVEAD